jgi:NAD(P)-dependent dehydrogenase (short-subunit alcohol dehydrogenase family)
MRRQRASIVREVTSSPDRPRSAVVFGARNFGRATIERLRAEGWAVTGIARSEETRAGITAAGATALEADVTDPVSVFAALEHAAETNGGVELVLNAASAYGGDRSGPFGGGPLAEAAPDAFDAWAAAPARAAFSFLSGSARFLLAQGTPATVIQATGGSARRAAAGRGLWAAGAFGVRALTQAAALELREHGIHVSLLVIDAQIQPFSDHGPVKPEQAAPGDLADAVLFLAEQGARGATHELQITPLAERWVP